MEEFLYLWQLEFFFLDYLMIFLIYLQDLDYFFQSIIASISWVNNLSIDKLDFSYINPRFFSS